MGLSSRNSKGIFLWDTLQVYKGTHWHVQRCQQACLQIGRGSIQLGHFFWPEAPQPFCCKRTLRVRPQIFGTFGGSAPCYDLRPTAHRAMTCSSLHSQLSLSRSRKARKVENVEYQTTPAHPSMKTPTTVGWGYRLPRRYLWITLRPW